jgi:hypothetical protein
MTDQNQKAGDNSTNIQAGSINIQRGVSATEVRQIALDVFWANFLQLTGEARDIARRRAEEFTEEFLKRLQEQHAVGLQQAKEPDFQYALFTAQKEYARTGDKPLGDLLVDLLVDRTKQPARSILQIVLNESLAVAPKLTSDQIAALSLIFLFRYTTNPGIVDHTSLLEYLDELVAPLALLISPKNPCYQHLEYSGCGTVGIGSASLTEIFRRRYGGLFSKGFEKSQLAARQILIPESHDIFTQCLNENGRLQVNAMDENTIRSECARMGISGDDALKLAVLHKETLMTPDEVRQAVITWREYMKGIFDVWEKSSMTRFTLTSVGIAIGHANIKKNIGEFADLSIWIN